jgi:hypothetical protein
MRVYQLQIRTSATNTCVVTVPEHEVRLLEIIHTSDNVDADSAVLLDECLGIDVHDEYERLATKYQNPEALEKAYGNDTKRALFKLLEQNSQGEAPEAHEAIVLDGPDTPIVKKGLPTLPKASDAPKPKKKAATTAESE